MNFYGAYRKNGATAPRQTISSRRKKSRNDFLDDKDGLKSVESKISSPSPMQLKIDCEFDELTDSDKERSDGDQHENQFDFSSDSDKETEEDFSKRTAIFPGSPITQFESFLGSFCFCLKHGHSKSSWQDLLNLLLLHFPIENEASHSVHLFRKFFEDLETKILIHDFCPSCFYGFQPEDTSCPSCGKLRYAGTIANQRKKIMEAYFIEMNWETEIVRFFQSEKFCNALRYRFERNTETDSYSDIIDGSKYQSLFLNHGFLSKLEHISLLFNCDGASVFKSSHLEVWPLFFAINELPPEQMRFVRTNMILGGLWFGVSKPNMNLFLKPFRNKLKSFYHNGFPVTNSPLGKEIVVRGILLCGVCDLPAKALVQEHVFQNGYYGCTCCESEAIRVPVGEGFSQVHPYQKPGERVQRTFQSVLEQAREAIRDGEPKKGINGPSQLMDVPEFILVEDMRIDYMHGIAGIMKKLNELWFSSSHSKEAWYIGRFLQQIDAGNIYRLSSHSPTFPL
eukprot:Pompholyxophrys_punicea_v1_NODE_133_length_3286_cov_14.739709.p1 type:complete len:509 gc:universal NODE_133_length_3286_cov_14.739709:1595-69(-)